MEFSDTQIAKLVLGYLKLQKSKNAYNEFLKYSPHLKQFHNHHKFGTRIGGLTLIEYLTQYAAIYTIIQAWLESTNYFNEKNKKHTLVDELLYLLDHINDCSSTIISCASTPHRNVHIESPNFISDLSEGSINTMALEDLPGYDTTKEKLKNLLHEKRGYLKETGVESDLSILLEKYKLREVIKENTNVICNLGNTNNLQVQNDEKSNNNISEAVDSTIKTVIEKKESGPYHKKVISVIKVSGDGLRKNKERSGDDLKKLSELITNDDNNNAMSENFKKNDNSNKRGDAVYHFNSEAIQSITASFTKINNQQTSIPTTIDGKQDVNNSTNKNSGNVILFPGNLDHYMKSSDKTTTNTTSTLISNNLLMAQPQIQNKIVSESNNVQTSTVLIEQDISNIPTTVLREYKDVEPQLLVRHLSTQPEYMSDIQSSSKLKNLELETITKPATTTKSQSEIYAENKFGSCNDNVKFNISGSNTSIDIKIPFETTSTPTETLTNNPKKEAKLSTIKEVKQLQFASDTTKPTSPQLNRDVNKQKDETQWNDFQLRLIESTMVCGMDVRDKETDDEVYVTPELKEIPTSRPIISKKNILPCLETPIKDSCLDIPKTPGMFNPLNITDTPLTKVFKENLKCVDLSKIPTPKFPLTPTVPITPTISNSNFPNKLTNYSTSSSYYHPSDTEENKSLEKLIMNECNKRTDLNKIRNEYVEIDKFKQDIVDKTKSMKTNKIGSEKLSPVKKNSPELYWFSSESEIVPSNDESEYILSLASNSDSNTSNNSADNIVLDHETLENIRYPLRSRTRTRNSVLRSSPKIKLSNNNGKLVPYTENETKIKKHTDIFSEMEKKRQRTISKLMNSANKKKNNDKKTRKVAQNPKKTFENVNKKATVSKKSIEMDTLHSKGSSTSHSKLERLKPLETNLSKRSSSVCLSNCTQNVESDEEAEKLVKGLNEMGILLVRNSKRTNKVTEETNPIKFLIKENEVKQKKRQRKADILKKRAKPKTTFNKKLDSSTTQKTMTEILLENETMKIDCDLLTEKNSSYHESGTNDNINDATKSNDNIPLNLNVSSQNIIFDTKTYENETYSFIYDKNKTSRKKLSDYNFELTKKGLHATVYLEELDLEIKKCILPTPISFILDIPSKDEN